jgi:hypothetical protein
MIGPLIVAGLVWVALMALLRRRLGRSWKSDSTADQIVLFHHPSPPNQGGGDSGGGSLDPPA